MRQPRLRPVAARGALALIALAFLLATTQSACAPCPANDPSAEAARAATARARGIALLLPTDTSWLAVSADLQHALDALGRTALVRGGSEPVERARAKSVVAFDQDLLSSEGQAELGLSPRGPAGVAGLGPGRDGLVVFASLARSGRFKAAAYRYFHQRDLALVPRVVDTGLVLASRDDKSFAIVVRGSFAMAVLTRGASDAGELAQELAGLGPSDSLAASAPFRAATEALSAPSDLLLYLDPRPLLRQQVGLEARWSGATFAQAAAEIELAWRKALGRARDDGASVERMVAIDDEFRAARLVLREDPAAERWRAWIASLGPLALGLDVLPSGIRARGALRLEPGSPVARLLWNRQAAPVLVSRLPERPSLLLQVTANPEMLGELGVLAGVPVEELGKELGLDLGKELAASLDGQLGIALLHDLDLRASSSGTGPAEAPAFGPVRVAAVLGVRDAARARALLGKLAKAAGTAGWLEAGAKDGELVLKRRGEIPLRLAVGAHEIVVSSDPSLGASLASDGPAASWEGTGHRMLRRLAASRDAALDLGLDLGLLALPRAGLFLAATAPSPAEAASAPPPTAPGPGAAAAAVATVAAGAVGAPPAPEVKAKADEIRAVEQLIARLQRQLESRRATRPVELARRVGTVGLRVKRMRTGLLAEAAWAVGTETVSALVAVLLDELWPAEPQRKDEAELEAYLGELSVRRARLEAELEALPGYVRAPTQDH
jgi:hypothetical protein